MFRESTKPFIYTYNTHTLQQSRLRVAEWMFQWKGREGVHPELSPGNRRWVRNLPFNLNIKGTVPRAPETLPRDAGSEMCGWWRSRLRTACLLALPPPTQCTSEKTNVLCASPFGDVTEVCICWHDGIFVFSPGRPGVTEMRMSEFVCGMKREASPPRLLLCY